MSNDILNEASLRSDRIVVMMPRVIPIGQAWVSETFSVRHWGFLGFAAVVALMLRWKPRRDLVAAVITSTAVLTLVYIVTPRDLTKHLATSLERVAIAPMGLFALTVATATVPRRLDPSRRWVNRPARSSKSDIVGVPRMSLVFAHRDDLTAGPPTNPGSRRSAFLTCWTAWRGCCTW